MCRPVDVAFCEVVLIAFCNRLIYFYCLNHLHCYSFCQSSVQSHVLSSFFRKILDFCVVSAYVKKKIIIIEGADTVC